MGELFRRTLLTVELVRHADPALREYMALECSDSETPLGLTGDYVLETVLMGRDCDYGLPDLIVHVSPDMTVWDLLRVAADCVWQQSSGSRGH